MFSIHTHELHGNKEVGTWVGNRDVNEKVNSKKFVKTTKNLRSCNVVSKVTARINMCDGFYIILFKYKSGVQSTWFSEICRWSMSNNVGQHDGISQIKNKKLGEPCL